MGIHGIRARVRGLGLRIRFLFRKGQVEAEMEEELRFHLEEEIRANLQAGLSPKEARRQALLLFGGVERFKEELREARGTRPLEELAQDLRYSLRQLRRTPLFSAVAVLTLGLGIGANTGLFSVVNGLLLKDRPYRSPEQLVHIYSAVEHQTLYATSYAQDLQDLRGLDDTFSGVGAFAGMASRIMGPQGAQMVLVECVTANLLPLLGIPMHLGRSFGPDEDGAPGANPVTILGYGLWQRRYGSDPGVIGRTIRMAGRSFTIIGVAPRAMESLTAQGFQTDFFVPMSMVETFITQENPDVPVSARGVEGYKIIGRLRDGVGMEQARARVEGVAMTLKEEYPQLYRDRSFNLHPTRDIALQPDLDAVLRMGAALLMGAVGLVLLLACTNLASFLLARGVDRRQEMAMRLALGARRGRLVRQLLTETLTLGVLGAVLGVFLARWTLDLIVGLSPPSSLPLNIDVGLDGRVLLFTAGTVGLVGILAGLAPALHSTKPALAPTLKDGSVVGGKAGLQFRSGLVGLQMGVSTVLLITGGLFLRSMQAAQRVDPGFGVEDAALLWVDLGVSGIPRAEWPSLGETLKDRAQALPGVEVVALSNAAQLSEALWEVEAEIPGVDPPPYMDFHRVYALSVDPEYLKALEIPVVRGRGIEARDREGAEPVVVVSQAAANRFWPEEDPLGREVRLPDQDRTYRIVGVTRDTRVANLTGGPEPLFYFSREQSSHRASQLWVLARGARPPAETVARLREMARELNPDLVVVQAKTLREMVALSLFLPRLGGMVLGFFGVLALALAAVGLFGVVSHGVSRRSREMGIRMSLGAGSREVVVLLVREAMGVVWMGSALGLLASLGLVRLLGSFLTGVEAYDPVTLVSVPLLLVFVAFLAAALPARRAGRVDPARTLRADGT